MASRNGELKENGGGRCVERLETALIMNPQKNLKGRATDIALFFGGSAEKCGREHPAKSAERVSPASSAETTLSFEPPSGLRL